MDLQLIRVTERTVTSKKDQRCLQQFSLINVQRKQSLCCITEVQGIEPRTSKDHMQVLLHSSDLHLSYAAQEFVLL